MNYYVVVSETFHRGDLLTDLLFICETRDEAQAQVDVLYQSKNKGESFRIEEVEFYKRGS